MCAGCYLKLKGTAAPADGLLSSRTHSLPEAGASGQPSSGATGERSQEEEDEELKRVLELSLKETRGSRPVAPPARPSDQVCSTNCTSASPMCLMYYPI